jgi:hypothetical protein
MNILRLPCRVLSLLFPIQNRSANRAGPSGTKHASLVPESPQANLVTCRGPEGEVKATCLLLGATRNG